MADNTYRLASLFIQGLGVVYLIFYLGRYVGNSTAAFKTIFKELREIKTDHASFVREDNDRHTKLGDALANLRVEVAGEKRLHARRRGDPQ